MTDLITELLAEFIKLAQSIETCESSLFVGDLTLSRYTIDMWITRKKTEFHAALDLLSNLEGETRSETEESDEDSQEEILVSEEEGLEPVLTQEILDQARAYDKPSPPLDLVDKVLNEEILKSQNLDNEGLFVYLRTITHPYKHAPSEADLLYLNYLCQVENWSEQHIQYLTQGLNFKFVYDPNAFIGTEIQQRKVDEIEAWIVAYEKDVSKEAPRIQIELSEAKFNIKYKKKKLRFDSHTPMSHINKWLLPWGFMLDPSIGLDQEYIYPK
jgi:hypothetical protein